MSGPGAPPTLCMVRTSYPLALLLATLYGCLASPPPHTPFPPPTDAYPVAIRDVAVAGVLLYASGTVRCSAVAVKPDVVYTARHCVTSERVDPELLWLQAVDGHGVRLATLGGTSPYLDVAWLTPSEPVDAPVEQAARQPEPGELAWLVGYGCSDGRRLEARPARYTQRLNFGADEIAVDEYRGEVCHGDSGGAVLNDQGRLVGILSRVGTGDSKGFAYAAPVN